MSCIRFTPAAERDRRRGAGDGSAGRPLSNEDAAVLHLAPPVTGSKIARLRLLAEHASPGIRESVASNRHAPADLLGVLARDPAEQVRSAVARNESTPSEVLAALTADSSARVRSWLVVNVATPDAVLVGLSADPDATVRRLLTWREEGDRASRAAREAQPAG